MDEHAHHEELIQGAVEQLGAVFRESGQGIYLYLDDAHKACNERFARLLGYTSGREWAAVDRPFLDAFVDPRSRDTLAATYRDAMERLAASSIEVTWRKKMGETAASTVHMVPFTHAGHRFALHFVAG